MLLLCAAEMGCALAVVTGSLAARCGGDYTRLLLRRLSSGDGLPSRTIGNVPSAWPSSWPGSNPTPTPGPSPPPPCPVLPPTRASSPGGQQPAPPAAWPHRPCGAPALGRLCRGLAFAQCRSAQPQRLPCACSCSIKEEGAA